MPRLNLNLKLSSPWANKKNKNKESDDIQPANPLDPITNPTTPTNTTTPAPLSDQTCPILSCQSFNPLSINLNLNLSNNLSVSLHDHPPQNLLSPSPLQHEITIAVLHGQATANPILATIQSRLAATGFVILAQRLLNLPDHSHLAHFHLSPKASEALSLGDNLVYLLSRSRAIQVWKDLVGALHSRPDMPARPGSLRFMFGPDAVWAAETSAIVAQLLAALWPDSEHLNHPQFAIMPSPPHIHLPLVPIPSPEHSPRPQKRVFKFSRAVQPSNLLPITPPDPEPAPAADPTMADRSDGPSSVNDDRQRPRADSLDRSAGSPSQPSVIDSGLAGAGSCGRDEMTQEAPALRASSGDSPSALEPDSAALSALSVRSSEPPTPLKPTHSPNPSQHTLASSLASPLPSSSSFSSFPDAHSQPTSAHSSPDRLCAAPVSPPSSATSLSTAPPPADAPPTPRQRPMMLQHKHDGSLPFRARPVPATTAEPTASPRMSKAALLRLGLPWTPPERPLASSHSSLSDASTRPPIAPVASLGPPSVVPRPTRASALRTGGGAVAAESPVPRLKRSESKIFEHTPGHGFRRAHLQTNIASCAAPKTEPRHTKASALRTGAVVGSGETGSGAGGRSSPRISCASGGSGRSAKQRLSGVSFEGVPGHRRKEKIEVKATNRPEIEPRMTRASLLRIGGGAAVVAGRHGGGGADEKVGVGKEYRRGVNGDGKRGKEEVMAGVAGGRDGVEGYGEEEGMYEEGGEEYEEEEEGGLEEEYSGEYSGSYHVEEPSLEYVSQDEEKREQEEPVGRGDQEEISSQREGGGQNKTKIVGVKKENGEGFGFVTILSS